MFYRLAGNHLTLVVITFSVLFGAAGIMTAQIDFLVENHTMNFIPTETGLEQNIAILIAAFGVFLEHRRYILNKIYSDAIPANIEQFDDYTHNTGVMFILVAILMEATDLFFLALNNWSFDTARLKYVEITLLFAINILACAMFVKFGARTLGAARTLNTVA